MVVGPTTEAQEDVTAAQTTNNYTGTCCVMFLENKSQVKGRQNRTAMSVQFTNNVLGSVYRVYCIKYVNLCVFNKFTPF